MMQIYGPKDFGAFSDWAQSLHHDVKLHVTMIRVSAYESANVGPLSQDSVDYFTEKLCAAAPGKVVFRIAWSSFAIYWADWDESNTSTILGQFNNNREWKIRHATMPLHGGPWFQHDWMNLQTTILNDRT